MEEHTVLTRKLLTRGIYCIIAAQVLLAVVDRFPVWLSLLSVASHGVYLGNLRHFPIVKLSDPVFVVSCGMSVLSFLGDVWVWGGLGGCVGRGGGEVERACSDVWEHDVLMLGGAIDRSRRVESLLVVPPFLPAAAAAAVVFFSLYLPAIPLRSPADSAHIYGNFLFFWHLRLAHPVLTLRVSLRQ